MLTRRQARVKVMQQLYGYWQNKELPEKQLIKNLRHQFDATYEAYLFALLCIRETALYVHTYADIQATKLLSKEVVSTQIATSGIISFLSDNESLNKSIKKRKLLQKLDDELPRKWFRALATQEIYKHYTQPDALVKPSDEEVLIYLLKEVLLQDEAFDQLMEAHYPVWEDDYDIITQGVVSTIEGLARETFMVHDDFLRKSEDVGAFAEELLEKTIAHQETAANLIQPKLKNWDLDRIAVMDLLLMNMALTEILDCPTIPVKVTMNEYIDISKRYSTPKSKEFINGVLDKIVKDLRKEKKIFKTGRGLQE